MLKLKDIKKNYYVADMTVEALKGINLCFRKNEFVSILGPSGCGKTTLLNIIGGLDQYTSGDLFINGKSTKNFNDRDWDVYRNHRIGFIFQSYNLIPHQTILGNVELALTISGVSKVDRQARAKRALDKVGLSKQYNKKPNQLSGGQCQRVAIARALVNDPEILLADEPTGALDTETSIQIMDLIQEIAKERLVIMVTHNPELAYKYSTRIVKCLDGNVIEDSNPFKEDEEAKEIEELKIKEENESTDETLKKIKKEKSKMSYLTAFRLSARNLQAKFKRTFMVALAGCIGIVGVSTVLAVSNGVQGYISDMENDMLSGYPVYITTSSLDYSSIMGGGLSNNSSSINPSNDISSIYISSLVKTLYNMNGVTSTNKIGKDYMNFLSDMPNDACELIQYNYGYKIAPNLYTDFRTSDGQSHKMSVSAIQSTYVSVLKNIKDFKDYASMVNSVSVMTEIPSNANYISNQYDVVYIEDGYTLEDVINDKTSLIAVASKKSNTLNDLELAEYGYFSQEVFLNYCYKIGNSEEYNPSPILQMPETISYETLASKEFTWYPNDTVFKKGESSDELGDKYYASAYADGTLEKETDEKWDNYKRSAFGTVDGSVDLNVKCVLKLKSDLSYGCLTSGGLYYTNALSEHMRDYTYGNKKKGINQSKIVESALDSNGLYNVELGYKFKFDGNSKASCEKNYLSSNSSSAIMDYIAQFMSSDSSNSSKELVSYSAQALGGADYPITVYFYCNNFEQKNILTKYLDKWNNSTTNNLYKVDSNGFYTGKIKNDDGSETTTYYYKDSSTNKYFRVNVNSNGYAEDYLGNQYHFKKDDNGDYGFYLKESDSLGENFNIEDSIHINNNVSVNAYSLLKYTMLGKEFPNTNINYNNKEIVPNTGDKLYRFKNSDGDYEYVMKVRNQSYYKVKLDNNGSVVATQNGYDKYRYDSTNDKFYMDNYVLVSEDYYIKNPNEEYIKTEDKIYKLESTLVETDDISKLYSDDKKYSYQNVSKNPTIEVNGKKYFLDTKGFYLDTTSLQDVSMSNTSDLLNNFIINTYKDNDQNKLEGFDGYITFRDYSKYNFFYRDLADNGETFYFVDYEFDITANKGIINAKDVSDYLDNNSLSSIENISSYIADSYYINEDGTLQAIIPNYSDSAATITELLDNKIIGAELTDLSILDHDDSLKIEYTDMIGLIIDMVNTLIQVITYSLIAFTALSLVVSTVMIGIITYVSVVERTKEIGVIRALGGRKKDVAHLFNAETFIIGFVAGLLGILITYLLSLIINLILGSFVGIYTIANLPWYQAIFMIVLSVVLTLISGLIPAKSAAKRDPVIALRTE